jgi:hypothetical protein
MFNTVGMILDMMKSILVNDNLLNESNGKDLMLIHWYGDTKLK